MTLDSLLATFGHGPALRHDVDATGQPVDLDAIDLYRAGCRPSPYAREILSAVRHERARLADEPSEP